MDTMRAFIFLVWLLYVICITYSLDVKTEVGPVEYGKSVTLKCTLPPPNTAVQVTWTKVVGDKEVTVAIYTSDSGAEITKSYKDRLWMSTSGLNETAITVHKTNIQDKGCYRCIFNFLPNGSKEGEVCLQIPGKVLIEKHLWVRLFQPVTLKCINIEDSKVVQISWQKNDKNIATYEKGEYIAPEYKDAISVAMEGVNVTSLTVFRANVSDEGNYKCIFNIFPGGALTGETFLQVYDPLNVTVSKSLETGCLMITCVAKSWPPSKISWLDVDEGSLNDTTYDGFLTVTSRVLISSPDSQKKPQCKVLYLGKEYLHSVSAGARSRLHPVIIGLLVSKIFFL
ncbi:OX-2 membrane glycoprotein-like [Bufo bufo]|uniref:OX-2 membrane glycoprotein-like n=1 Tax=Bufo bufo TaxID=8384 RepID=UPI001ABE4D04|nr:OX-2 membrane glycoprotein-like [Bufo bufo]